jgi:hypothetical protein
MHGTRQEGALLLAEDPDLGAGLSAEEFALARGHLRARVEVVETGGWEPAAGRYGGGLGLLVLDGLLARDVSVRDRCCVELLGTGDLLRPWDEDGDIDLSVDRVCRWEVLEPARVAVLDRRCAALLARWPAIVEALLFRTVRRTRTMGLQFALTQVEGVEVRAHLMLWHLADRWGRVTPAGVLLPLPLTHRLLARLIGSRRPSVTSALRRLDEEGLVKRTDDGGWLLHGSPDEVHLEHRSRRVPAAA